MTVHNIETESQFTEAIAKNETVVIDWFAQWCGPCKAISPTVAKWSNEMPNVYFAKVDVDALPELTAKHEIRAMPTFTIFKDGKKADEFVGAQPPKLLALIQKYNVEEKKAEEKTEEKA